MHTLIGSEFGGGFNSGNTVFCIFEPFAKGLEPDAFPTEESVYFGSRVGGLYPYCISRYNDPPKSSPNYERHLKNRIEFIKKRRLKDKGEETVDPALIERIIWEGDNGKDGPGLATIMRDLAKKHPAKPGSKDSVPVLPLMPRLDQAINMGATDNRAVLAIVLPADGKDTMSDSLARLLHEQGIAGLTHAARLTAAEWAIAKESGQAEGAGEREAGAFFMYPGTWGLSAVVKAEIAPTADLEELRTWLKAELKRFAQDWRKLDRQEHLELGRAEQINWHEWDPRYDQEIQMVPQKKGTGGRAGHAPREKRQGKAKSPIEGDAESELEHEPED